MKRFSIAVALLLAMLCPWAVSAQNQYGFTDNIPEGNILHCFSWPIKDIKAELPNIAASGFGSIQISPMQRPDINEGWTWYTIYLPYDYGVFSSPGMGSREDLRELCAEAEKYGIKIIVDVVLNHVNKTEPYYNPWFNVEGRYRHWGNDGGSKWINYGSRYSITHDPLGDYVELNTENAEVIARAKQMIEDLKSLGVKGIRYDAAKHIELPLQSEGGSQIWPTVSSVTGLFHYGEVVGNCSDAGDDEITEYAKYIWVPNNLYSTDGSKNNGGIPYTSGSTRDKLTGGQLIYWGESHDDYSNDEWSERMDQGIIDRAYCALASRNKQAALYYSRPRARGKDNIKIEKGSMAFMGKHIVEVNKFRNAMLGKADYYSYNGNDAASITRQGGGAVIVAKGSNVNVTVDNGGGYCPSGTYKDRVSGNTFTVTASTISGEVGPTGVAVIYGDNIYKTTPTPERVTITGTKAYNVAYSGDFSNGNNYIHYWSDNKSIETKWPGVKMERAKGSDGKYYWCYAVPAGVTNVIFNNGNSHDNGGMQTGDLKLTSDYVMDNGGATIVPVAFTTGTFDPEPAKPSPTAKTVTIDGDYNMAFSGEYKYVYYWDASHQSDLDWPGVLMQEAVGDDGQKYKCFKVPSGTSGIVFNNGEKEDNKNLKTGDLKYSGSKVMCESGPSEVNVIFMHNGQVVEPEPEPGTVTIVGDYNIAYNGTKENVHYWGGLSDSGWPGKKMTVIKGSDGKDYKVAKVSANTQKVIFNTNGNEDKTGDLIYSGTYIMNDNGATGTPVKFIIPEVKLSDVYIYVDGWAKEDNVYCYLYLGDGNTENSPWPGIEMSIDEETGYWVYQVPEGLENASVVVSNASKAQYPTDGGLSLGGSSKILHINGYKWNNYPETDVDPDPTPTPGEAEEPDALPDQADFPPAISGTYCYFVNYNDWEDINVWAWNSNGNLYSKWPGKSIKLESNKVAENIYIWKNDTGKTPTNIIFSDNGNNETSTLTFTNKAIYSNSNDYFVKGDSSFPDKVYMLGTFPESSWSTSYGLELKKVSDKGIYLAYGIVLEGGGGYSSFSFTEGFGDNWDNLNANFNRYGSAKNDLLINSGETSIGNKFLKEKNASSCKSWKIKNGTYDVILDLYNMAVTLIDHKTVAAVNASQLAEVQKETAVSSIKNYDYITYPAENGKAQGVTVNGDVINIKEINVSDEIYHNGKNVLFTENSLVTTDFTGNSGSKISPETASIGKKQADGKFRGIVTLDNLEENILSSKVNYYYTLTTPYDVGKTFNNSVRMQSPAGSASVKLAVPEPKLVHSGIEVTKSAGTLTFNYKNTAFDALYNTATAFVEIEDPNITDALDQIAGTLYRVRADGKSINGTTHISQVISPTYFLNDSFEAPSVDLHSYETDVIGTGRWAASKGNIASSISMSYTHPTVNNCEVTFYGINFEPVTVGLRTEEHFFEHVYYKLNVTTAQNSIVAYNASDEDIKTINLNHTDQGDWYLVEFYNGNDLVATHIVEGFDGEKEYQLKIDHGQRREGLVEDVLANSWYNSQDLKVHVSALYPFMAPSAQAAPDSRLRAAGNAMTSTIIESDADIYPIAYKDNIPTGIDERGDGSTTEIVQYYNMQGLPVVHPGAPGIYIVRFANGQTKKILVK